MKISINDLGNVIDATILQRGKDYLKRGLVAELEEVEEDAWSALVEGTQTYEVKVKLEGDEIVESICDCPYDFGPVCKHEVAVYLAIGHMLAGKDLPEKKKKRSQTKPKRKTVADKISDIVAKLTEEEMREIVLEYALNDREFRNTLLVQDLLKRDEAGKNKKEDYKRIMRDSLRSGMDRHGFIGYWSSSRAVRGIEELVYEANKMLAEQKPERAVPIYQAAIEETVPALQYADDSSGNLGEVIELSFEKLNECAEDITDKNVRKDLFLTGHHEFKYYDKLKNTYPQEEWLDIVDRLIKELVESRKCGAHIMGEIFVREEKWPELLNLVKNNLSEYTLDSFGKYLEGFFLDDLIEMHEQVIREMLKRTSGRAIYQDACRRLRRMKKIGAGERVIEMAEEFRLIYKNRRALLEELAEFSR